MGTPPLLVLILGLMNKFVIRGKAVCCVRSAVGKLDPLVAGIKGKRDAGPLSDGATGALPRYRRWVPPRRAEGCISLTP